MDYFKISDMNEASRDPAEFIRWSQERYDAKVEAAAIQILEAAEQGKPLVLLSGPSGSGKTTTAGRITLLHKNIPNSLSQFTAAISGEGINIAGLVNKSRGDYAYTMLDLDHTPSDHAVEALKKIDGVLRVRIIK